MIEEKLNIKDLDGDVFEDLLNDFLHYLELIFRIDSAEGQYVFLNSAKIDQDGSDFLNSIGVSCNDFYKGYECYFDDDFLEKFPEVLEDFPNIEIKKMKKPKLIWQGNYNINFEGYKNILIPQVIEKAEEIVRSYPSLNTSMLINVSEYKFLVDLVCFCEDIDLEKLYKQFDFKDRNKLIPGKDLESLLLYAGDKIYSDDLDKIVSHKPAIYDGRESVPGIYRNGVKRKITSTGMFPEFSWNDKKEEGDGMTFYFSTNVHYSLIESFVDLLKAKKIKPHKFLELGDAKVILTNDNGEYALNQL